MQNQRKILPTLQQNKRGTNPSYFVRSYFVPHLFCTNSSIFSHPPPCGGRNYKKNSIFTKVKSIASILLLTTYLFATTHLGELVKLPILVIHYLEHHHQDSKTSVWSFLYSHYGKAHGNNQHKNDSNLPFKSAENCNNNLVSSFCNLIPIYSFKIKLIEKVNTSFSCNSLFFHSSNFEFKIWQPPKFSY